ncbi:ATP-binding protein [Arthrobacter sp. B0490]|uniref:ATP-binding protein n=1 Tax=Arthrobacter sp. B0490 TaxID=2058891 RepID=UPI001C6701F7|nr:ATP-binding protein [Arthrobacter sp. B0490]
MPDDRPDVPTDGLTFVAQRCELSPFETDIIALTAACELQPFAARLCARLHGDPHRRYPTFGLALSVLEGPHWDAVASNGALRRLHLVEMHRSSEPFLESRLSLPERILMMLLGHDAPDPELVEDAEPVASTAMALTERQSAVVADVMAILSRSTTTPVALWGREADRQPVERSVAWMTGSRWAWRVRSGMLAAEPSRLGLASQRLARESALTGAPVIVDPEDATSAFSGWNAHLMGVLVAAGCRLIVSSSGPVRGLPAGTVRREVPAPTFEESRSLWASVLREPQIDGLDSAIDRVAAHFRPGPEALVATASAVAEEWRVSSGVSYSDTRGPGESLWNACRLSARTDLGGLAERREPSARWEDLVLPVREADLLRDVLRHARHRALVHEQWRIAGSDQQSAGVTALFSGPSGTGKTLAADVIAGELGVDVLSLDLSQVMSRWLGETEKALGRVFDAAEQSGAVLVINEADSLLGKRSAVKDSHDRYANIEVSYLLQRMERFRGLAVLTSNLRGNIDEAFLRRLSFVVDFPFPDEAARASLWQRAFGPRVPVAGLDHQVAARLMLSGGSIRNVAVNAAFLAADDHRAVTMADILHGAQAEYAKLGRTTTPSEVGEWPA